MVWLGVHRGLFRAPSFFRSATNTEPDHILRLVVDEEMDTVALLFEWVSSYYRVLRFRREGPSVPILGLSECRDNVKFETYPVILFSHTGGDLRERGSKSCTEPQRERVECAECG